jgi:hypothetical protein
MTAEERAVVVYKSLSAEWDDVPGAEVERRIAAAIRSAEREAREAALATVAGSVGAEVRVRLPEREIHLAPEALRAIVRERFRVARMTLRALVKEHTGVDIGEDDTREAALEEAAALADGADVPDEETQGWRIAEAIRALKAKEER